MFISFELAMYRISVYLDEAASGEVGQFLVGFLNPPISSDLQSAEPFPV